MLGSNAAAGFAGALEEGRFLVITEQTPPKGTELGPFLRRTQRLAGLVDGISLTESSNAVMAMSPVGVVAALLRQGHTPLLHVLCRDRNRIALQADLLSAAALGVSDLVCMQGDPVAGGDHQDAAEVGDLDTTQLLEAVASLNAGRDLAGRALQGAPAFCAGAVVDPGSQDLASEIGRMERKAEAGARFFLTQAVYEPAKLERFMQHVDRLHVPVIATYIVPKSGEMARRLNRSLPGVSIPGSLITRLDAAGESVDGIVEASGPALRRLATMARGLNIIAVGWEQHFERILAVAGIERTRQAGHAG